MAFISALQLSTGLNEGSTPSLTHHELVGDAPLHKAVSAGASFRVSRLARAVKVALIYRCRVAPVQAPSLAAVRAPVGLARALAASFRQWEARGESKAKQGRAK